MADIFSKIANSPVAFGVIKGATDLFVAGKTAAEKRNLRKEKERNRNI
jgi:hypothetical protein